MKKLLKIIHDLSFAIFLFAVPLISWWFNYSVDKEMGLLLGYIMGWQFMKVKILLSQKDEVQDGTN